MMGKMEHVRRLPPCQTAVIASDICQKKIYVNWNPTWWLTLNTRPPQSNEIPDKSVIRNADFPKIRKKKKKSSLLIDSLEGRGKIERGKWSARWFTGCTRFNKWCGKRMAWNKHSGTPDPAWLPIFWKTHQNLQNEKNTTWSSREKGVRLIQNFVVFFWKRIQVYQDSSDALLSDVNLRSAFPF